MNKGNQMFVNLNKIMNAFH